ncbi:NRDE family protein [Chitinimonas sp. PSY-7]|uniref:NRDE family protein n=1 Tax=Chitinimonas sp. PSY-7 TaxID=3459088 RepID=UPI00403FEC87
MCLIGFEWQPGTNIPLRVAANRDEFYARPTAALAWWPEGDILAGCDLQAGGTWMGVSADGRFAALTNYRNPSANKVDAPSRGQLVVDFLRERGSAAQYLAVLREQAGRYNGFNLLVYDGRQLLAYESYTDRLLRFGRGIHAVSNAGFDTPWPKLNKLKASLAEAGQDTSALFAVLENADLAPDSQLPGTGVPLVLERALSAIFIQTPTYGTRGSSLLVLSREGAEFIERRFENGKFTEENHFKFEFSGLT